MYICIYVYIQEIEGGSSISDLLWPDKNTWEPEVHLNKKGQIRAVRP